MKVGEHASGSLHPNSNPRCLLVACALELLNKPRSRVSVRVRELLKLGRIRVGVRARKQ